MDDHFIYQFEGEDWPVRMAAFEHLRDMSRLYGGSIPWSVIRAGFNFGGDHYLLASAAEGIFKPRQLRHLLSLKTVVPKPKGRIWYQDQGGTHPLARPSETLTYAFRGSNPQSHQNQGLKNAMEARVPLVYFFGVAPGEYEALFPTYITDWNPNTLSCQLFVTPPDDVSSFGPPTGIAERRYAFRVVEQRLHQASFRQRVLHAYGRACAISGLPEPRLVDAAHIIRDRDEVFGEPEVSNGICLSKVHHAAFDADLIGIDRKGVLHVSDHLMRMSDGPLLELGLKDLAGRAIRLPRDFASCPDPERLARRFAEFEASGR